MGRTAAFVLARTANAGLVVPGHGAEDVIGCTGAEPEWSFGVFDEDVFWQRDELLPEVVKATGAPALVALTMDSDFLGVIGYGPGRRRWSGVVDAESAARYRADGLDGGFDTVVPKFAGFRTAVAGALAWAAAAGLVADESAVAAVFNPMVWSRPADQYWPDLVAALGLTCTGPVLYDDDAVEPAGPARKLTLSAYVSRHLAKPLKALGFQRHGMVFEYTEPRYGRTLEVAFRSVRLGAELNLHGDIDILDHPPLVADPGSERPPGKMLWMGQIGGPEGEVSTFRGPDGSETQILSTNLSASSDDPQNQERLGRVILDEVERLQTLLGTPALAELGVRYGTHHAALILADHGPSPELDAACARLQEWLGQAYSVLLPEIEARLARRRTLDCGG